MQTSVNVESWSVHQMSMPEILDLYKRNLGGAGEASFRDEHINHVSKVGYPRNDREDATLASARVTFIWRLCSSPTASCSFNSLASVHKLLLHFLFELWIISSTICSNQKLQKEGTSLPENTNAITIWYISEYVMREDT